MSRRVTDVADAGPAPDNGAASDACGNIIYHNATVMRYGPASLHMRVGDTVTRAGQTTSEVHGVTFLAGTSPALIPDWYFSTPDPGTTYDRSTFFNSAPLYTADAPRRDRSLTLTLTKAGRFGYLDVADAILGRRGDLIIGAPGAAAVFGEDLPGLELGVRLSPGARSFATRYSVTIGGGGRRLEHLPLLHAGRSGARQVRTTGPARNRPALHPLIRVRRLPQRGRLRARLLARPAAGLAPQRPICGLLRIRVIRGRWPR